ncbi:MAG: peptidase [Sphingomonadales bacterium]|nr:MAG: peptidase [Sphingomonadales bacterium]
MTAGVSAPAAAQKASKKVEKKIDKKAARAAEAEAIRSAVKRGEIMPLPRILAIAQGHVKGEVIKVELEHEKGRLTYEVKILAGNGRVREVELDARTGALIKIEND